MKNTSIFGKDYWKNFFKLLLQLLLTAIVGGIAALAIDSETLFIIILGLGILYFGRAFYIKNRLYEMDAFKNRLLETGEYDIERLNSMSFMELNLRQAFHKVVPNASSLSYDEFKALTKAKGKEAFVNAAKVASIIATSAEDAFSNKISICRNCGHRMGVLEKDPNLTGNNPCQAEGKRCVAVN